MGGSTQLPRPRDYLGGGFLVAGKRRAQARLDELFPSGVHVKSRFASQDVAVDVQRWREIPGAGSLLWAHELVPIYRSLP